MFFILYVQFIRLESVLIALVYHKETFFVKSFLQGNFYELALFPHFLYNGEH